MLSEAEMLLTKLGNISALLTGQLKSWQCGVWSKGLIKWCSPLNLVNGVCEIMTTVTQAGPVGPENDPSVEICRSVSVSIHSPFPGAQSEMKRSFNPWTDKPVGMTRDN